LREDAYGASLLWLCRLMPTLIREAEHAKAGDTFKGKVLERFPCLAPLTNYKTYFFLAVLIANLFMAMKVCLVVDQYLVQPAVRQVQQQYTSVNANLFSPDGSFLVENWKLYEDKEAICGIAMSKPVFFYIILSLHVMSCGVELRETFRFMYSVYWVPVCESVSQMHVWEHTNHAFGGVCYIVAIPGPVRWLVYLLLVYKTMIALYILDLGARLLASSTSFADVILNALVLEFVMQIDETLFQAFLPSHVQQLVRETVLFDRHAGPATIRDKWKSGAWGFRLGVVSMCCCFVYVLVWTNVFQTVLPSDLTHITIACQDHNHHVIPDCGVQAWRLYFNQQTCYPYGTALPAPLYQP